jgi:hypothetical protein
MTVLSVSAEIFACHSAACRPPTSGGTGGSGGGSKTGRVRGGKPSAEAAVRPTKAGSTGDKGTGYLVSGMVKRDETKSKTHAINYFNKEGFAKAKEKFAPAGKKVSAANVTFKRDGDTFRAHVGEHNMDIPVYKRGKHYVADGGRLKSSSLSGMRNMIAKEIQDVNNYGD